MNKRCPNCGFINFVSAEVCRKCETVLTDLPDNSTYNDQPTYRGGVNAYRAPYQTKRSTSPLKIFAYVFVGIVVLSSLGAWKGLSLVGRRTVKWIEYHPDGLNITVRMPDKPVRLEPILTPLPTGSMSNHRYVSTVPGQGTVVFCFVDFSGTFLEKSEMPAGLEDELQAFLQHSNSTLISKRSIDYQGMPGLEFEVKPPDSATKATRGYGKIFTSSTRLYLLSITAAEGSDLMAGKEKFLNPQITPTF